MGAVWETDLWDEEVTEMIHEFELRLIDAAAPDGEVRLRDLAELAAAIQELSLRVGRDLVHRAGPGRTHQVIEALTEMRLAGLDKGSTRLRFSRGARDELDLNLAADTEIDTKFWEVVEVVRANSRPAWMTDLLTESTGKVVAALKASAAAVEFVRDGEETIHLTTKMLRQEVWLNASTTRDTADDVVVSGRLEAVDLRNGKFSVCDDAGHQIALEHVPEPTKVAHLINHRVRALGVGVYAADGELKSIGSPSVHEQSMPDSWTAGRERDWLSQLSKPGPVLGEGAELSDEELADLMDAVKG